MSNEFKVDMTHLQRVQRTIRKAGNIFPNENALIKTLEEHITKAQDDESMNLYYSMSQYLKQRLKELKSHMDPAKAAPIAEAINDLTWNINYLQWLVTEQKEKAE